MKKVIFELPGLLGAVHARDAEHPIKSMQLPTLELALSKADKFPLSCDEFTSLADIEVLADCDPAWGANYLGLNEKEGGFWFRADPMSLKTETLSVYLNGNRQLSSNPQELESFEKEFNQMFAEDELQLHCRSQQECYLWSSSHSAVDFVSPLQAIGQDQLKIFPSGKDAPFWKKTLTEVQMMLHGSGLSQNSQLSGFNSLYLWGKPDQPLPIFNCDKLISNSNILLGAASASNIEHVRTPDTWHDVNLENSSCTQIVDLELLWLRRQALVSNWQQYLQIWQKTWLAPMTTALKNKQIDELWLSLGNDSVYRLKARYLNRFWRRNLPVEKFCC